MSVTISPNMNMPVPNVGLDTGPDWANNLNACLSIIDSHNHTSGAGAPIPSDAFNIATDLSFQNNSATNLKSLVLTPQTSIATLDALYVSGVDLYFNDGAGSPAIRITAGGNVNATSSGISSGTASATFVGGVLVVNAAATTPANIQVGSVLLGNNTPGTNFLTLAPPNAMGSSYGLVLPPLPASQKIMTLDASGNMTAPYTVDNSTITISSNVIGVPTSGITATQIATNAVTTAKILNDAVTTAKILDQNVTTAKIADLNVTAAKLAASNISSDPNGTTTTTSTGFVTANLAINFSNTRPILIVVSPNPDTGVVNGGTGGMQLALDRAGTNIRYIPKIQAGAADTGSWSWISQTTGNATYTIVFKSLNGSTVEFSNYEMTIVEL